MRIRRRSSTNKLVDTVRWITQMSKRGLGAYRVSNKQVVDVFMRDVCNVTAPQVLVALAKVVSMWKHVKLDEDELKERCPLFWLLLSMHA